MHKADEAGHSAAKAHRVMGVSHSGRLELGVSSELEDTRAQAVL